MSICSKCINQNFKIHTFLRKTIEQNTTNKKQNKLKQQIFKTIFKKKQRIFLNNMKNKPNQTKMKLNI